MDDIDIDTKRRLSGPGLRTVLNIAREWRLTTDEMRRLVGAPDYETYQEWRSAALGGKELVLREAVLWRLSCVLAVYRHIRETFSVGEQGQQWLHGEHKVFKGRRPIDLLLDEDIEQMRRVHKYVELVAWAQSPDLEPDVEVELVTARDRYSH
ncbi:antitoxin Xre/MbcA/ParS toxin-binding domain-containing protein [Tranquillimonas alkanivorans]|uniref:Uncharacterized protein n=1 Tax=Tranquillimonas alkanivorans TaxID=441119 RepID=A0A1I5W2G3_9RHOB|nr:antitoxin Xre/MbcA/ParS toxin-binding domain-containing protein [Tranquillimonas alkanivorans]SFQ13968.1 Protein of unknown function [Tranquillimonas alkanivorans]